MTDSSPPHVTIHPPEAIKRALELMIGVRFAAAKSRESTAHLNVVPVRDVDTAVAMTILKDIMVREGFKLLTETPLFDKSIDITFTVPEGFC